MNDYLRLVKSLFFLKKKIDEWNLARIYITQLTQWIICESLLHRFAQEMYHTFMPLWIKIHRRYKLCFTNLINITTMIVKVSSWDFFFNLIFICYSSFEKRPLGSETELNLSLGQERRWSTFHTIHNSMDSFIRHRDRGHNLRSLTLIMPLTFY